MARVTVEDCLNYIPNRFELSLIAGYRAKCLMAGAAQAIENKKKEKYTVIALREIGDNLLNIKELEESFKKELRNKNNITNNSNKPEKEEKENKKEQALGAFDLEKELDTITEEENKMFSEDNLNIKD